MDTWLSITYCYTCVPSNGTGAYFAEAVAKKLARGAILEDVIQGQTQLQIVRKRYHLINTSG